MPCQFERAAHSLITTPSVKLGGYKTDAFKKFIKKHDVLLQKLSKTIERKHINELVHNSYPPTPSEINEQVEKVTDLIVKTDAGIAILYNLALFGQKSGYPQYEYTFCICIHIEEVIVHFPIKIFVTILANSTCEFLKFEANIYVKYHKNM